MQKIQLAIPNPCHQNWEEMTPTQQGRFCSSCAKQVIDFTEMSDTAILNYLSSMKTGQLCGRVYPDQLERTIEGLPAKKKTWYWQYIMALFLFFSKSGTVKAQARVGKMVAPVNIAATENPSGRFVVHGLITNEDGKPVPFASIKIFVSDKGASADAYGKFSLETKQFSCRLHISATGYEDREVVTNGSDGLSIVLKKNMVVLEEVTVAGFSSSKSYSLLGGMFIKGTRTTGSNKVEPHSADTYMKTYPNPVTKGNSVTASLTLKETGHYTLRVNDAAGRLLAEKKITATAKTQNEKVFVETNWISGLYYLRLTNATGRQVAIGNLLVK